MFAIGDITNPFLTSWVYVDIFTLSFLGKQAALWFKIPALY
jgi:hypothetical protein